MMSPDVLREKLVGPVVAMTTHFKEDLSLDLDALRRLTEYYIQCGIQTVIADGSTGEFFSLTEEERKQVIKTVVDTAKGRMTVIAGTAHSGTDICLELTKYAQGIGADGVMITPPYYGYNGGGMDCLKSHYDKITNKTDIGVVIYFSGTSLPLVRDILGKPSLMLDLIDSCHGHASGFKDASGDYAFHRDVSLLLKDKVSVMGSAGMNYYLWGQMFGCPCFLTGLGNIWPQVELEFYDLLMNNRREEAIQIVQEKDLPYIAATVSTKRYWACVKALQGMVGLPSGPMRRPLLPITLEQAEMLRQVCTEIGLMNLPVAAAA
jgi:4-hydroxy-tetrahydrodipicolinate synthase